MDSPGSPRPSSTQALSTSTPAGSTPVASMSGPSRPSPIAIASTPPNPTPRMRTSSPSSSAENISVASEPSPTSSPIRAAGAPLPLASTPGVDPLIPFPSLLSPPRLSTGLEREHHPFGQFEVGKQIKEFRRLGDRFRMVVMTSTLTAALVLVLLLLAQGIFLNNHNTPSLSQSQPLEIAILLGFLTIITHLIIIVIAGRAATVSFHVAALGKKPRVVTLEGFHTYLYLCEQLQLMATITFLATILYLTFSLFAPQVIYPSVLCGYVVIGVYISFRTGLWKAPVFNEDIRVIWYLGRNLMGR
ncbi:hypothetical protein BDN72DRAFT_894926 [Pluteus cervinus]|uniref:Uncharacterized protein n=1 Tax=Pluteus cervinus TaxID=181527 RepID=A0ACD3B3R1_9AGAR|nr:hypothetical protein BDN72DRAFT_894926 [Pluteus cervinus]